VGDTLSMPLGTEKTERGARLRIRRQDLSGRLSSRKQKKTASLSRLEVQKISQVWKSFGGETRMGAVQREKVGGDEGISQKNLSGNERQETLGTKRPATAAGKAGVVYRGGKRR